ncbi:3-hydroxyacyl-CoA dehydrogenase [Oceaniserpentilla sp. 4NH20-0058]|uniref:SDR family NAD(P)-dependent oxidoreductase n=1 Tax=Oceaniserpentilla sp. 4NH20-0058 TaxID=3127660 RepID=UPI00310C39E4
MDLNKKVAIVTGGASGLGFATCKALVKQGCLVCIFDFNQENGQQALQQLGPDNALFIQVDVTDEASVESAITQCINQYKALHIIVNCAGIGPPAKVLNREGEPLALESFKQIINVNLFGTFNVLSKGAAHMAKGDTMNDDGGRGVIINVASVAAFDGQIGQPAYAASKAGIVGMGLPIAREFARYGIRVNTIAPGLFRTPLAESLGEEVVESLGGAVEYPKRLGEPSEFAKLVVHIAENDYLNGEVIRLDGAIRMAAK